MANNKKKSKKKIIIFSIIGAVVLLLVFLVFFAGKKEPITTVQTEEVKKQTITQTVTASGKIQAEKMVKINAEVSGEIIELPVKEGQSVKKGQLLVKIRPDTYIAQVEQRTATLGQAKSQLEQAQAALVKAEADYKREQELFAKKLASDQEMEYAEAAYLQAKANSDGARFNVKQTEAYLNQSKTDLAKTTIYSPMDGTISDLISELGERVTGSQFMSGTQMMTVAELSNMESQVEVGENDVPLVKIGDTCRVEVDAYPGRKFVGTVYEIANSAKTKGLGTQEEVTNFIVKIRILDKVIQFRPGMSCTADVETATHEDVIAVPIQSVTSRALPQVGQAPPGGQGGEVTSTSQSQAKKKKESEKPSEIVFVVENDVAKTATVKTGISNDKYIEVLDGLKGGERVVSGSYRAINRELENGKKVRVENAPKKPESGQTPGGQG
jgi:HlyD family secretion protein